MIIRMVIAVFYSHLYRNQVPATSRNVAGQSNSTCSFSLTCTFTNLPYLGLQVHKIPGSLTHSATVT